MNTVRYRDQNGSMKRRQSWNPFSGLSIFGDIEELLGDQVHPWYTLKTTYSTPHEQVTSTITDDQAVVSVDFPGVKKETLDICAEGSEITVTGKRGEATVTKKFQLQPEWDPQSGTAVLEDGVLHLTFGRKPEYNPKQVKIKVL